MGARVAAGVGVVALGVVLALVLLWSLQRRLVYFPYQAVPAAAGVLPGSEEVAFYTEDGLRLRGWFLPGRGGDGGAVLVCNGNGGNRAMRAPLAAALSRAGLSVLLFDYRGYGGNPGRPSEAGLAADGRAAQAWLAARVLRSPFTSLADIARTHYPWLPARLLLAERYPSLDRVRDLAVPLLVVAGERDGIVPAPQSRRLYEAAREPKRFVLVPGADHNDHALLAGDHLLGEVLAFLRGTPVLGHGTTP